MALNRKKVWGIRRRCKVQREVLRIIDANLNRSREGLRVCEEIARFILNSPTLTKRLKSVRHNISNIINGFTANSKILFESRDVKKDVGKKSRLESEMKRTGPIDIFCANMERAKESLRVLEEFFKLTDRKISARFTALRYRVYDIEKSFIRICSSLRDLR